jgi:hypothetical protein
VRSRTVVAKNRSGFLRSGLPACAADSAVIWCTITSGAAPATASPTDIASNPSMTTPSAPSRANRPSLAALVVVAVTWWPLATSRGTSHRPTTPDPPATNTRITITFPVSGCRRQPRRDSPGPL